jgi:hypothetical protein
MRTAALLILTAGVTLAAARADDPQDAKQLIDRALQAAGGADALAKPRAYTFKEEMTARSKAKPEGVVSKTTFYVHPPKQFRFEQEVTEGGKVATYVEVINGNKGWAKTGGAVKPLTAQTIARPNEEQKGFGYKYILLLRDSANTPATLGESKVGDRPVFGIKLTRPVGRGSEARRLYFDAQTGLLVKSETNAKLSTGGELASEQTWADYRTIDGIAVPHRVTHAVKNKEELFYERVYSDFRFVDKLDPHLFDKP